MFVKQDASLEAGHVQRKDKEQRQLQAQDQAEERMMAIKLSFAGVGAGLPLTSGAPLHKVLA